MHFVSKPLFCLVMFLGLSAPVFSLMPPDAEARAALERVESFAQRRNSAPDVVELRIVGSRSQFEERNRCPSVESWSHQAEVVSVVRGPLSPGQKIRLEYTRHVYRCPGPGRDSLTPLQTDQVVPAYLSCQEGVCQPAAGAASFDSEQRFEAMRQERLADVQRHSKPAPPQPPGPSSAAPCSTPASTPCAGPSY